MIKRAFPDHHYISLDLPGDAETAEHDPELFLARNPEPLIIDEIQHAPALFRWIKKRVASDRGKNGRFILSGSQKFVLMKGVQESLAGRVALVELFPLSIKEIGDTLGASYDFSQLKKTWASLILRGGYPALYENEAIQVQDFFRSYVGTYLERDIKEILNVSSLRDFERFLRAAAARAANLINKADIARDVGVSPTTVNDWISVLQTSNQVHLLEPWHSNRSKSIAKTPKLYFFDTGLLCFLLNIRDEATLQDSPLKGAIWENFVFSELYKLLAFQGIPESLRFWRDRAREVDFIVDRGGVVDLLESKWNSQPNRKDFAHIDTFVGSKEARHLKIRSSCVVCTTASEFPVGSRERVALSPMDLAKKLA